MLLYRPFTRHRPPLLVACRPLCVWPDNSATGPRDSHPHAAWVCLPPHFSSIPSYVSCILSCIPCPLPHSISHGPSLPSRSHREEDQGRVPRAPAHDEGVLLPLPPCMAFLKAEGTPPPAGGRDPTPRLAGSQAAISPSISTPPSTCL